MFHEIVSLGLNNKNSYFFYLLSKYTLFTKTWPLSMHKIIAFMGMPLNFYHFFEFMRGFCLLETLYHGTWRQIVTRI
jgi:hypothetical protein